MSNEGLVRILFRLDPSDWHRNGSERLWAEPLGNDRYRLRNTPFFAFGVSYEDVVLAYVRDGQLEFERAILRGGHSTYRLKVTSHSLNAEPFISSWARLQQLGCTFEEGVVVAVDVPPGADIHLTYSHLEAGETAGVWEFEEGHCGHPLRR